MHVCESPRSGGKDAVDGTMPTNTLAITKNMCRPNMSFPFSSHLEERYSFLLSHEKLRKIWN